MKHIKYAIVALLGLYAMLGALVIAGLHRQLPDWYIALHFAGTGLFCYYGPRLFAWADED